MAFQSYEQAPRYEVPLRWLSHVEHPGVVVDPTKAVKSLGGPLNIQQSFIEGSPVKPLGFKFRPDDPFRPPTFAKETTSGNLLIKITVPKRTGRKRKRGTQNPFVAESAGQCESRSIPTPTLLRRMRDNRNGYSVQPVGHIAEVYRFRSLPDFQYSLMSSPMANDFRRKVLSCDVNALKTFDMTRGRSGSAQSIDMIPPPIFSATTLPHLYGYSQNPNVKKAIDDQGRETTINTQHIGRTGATGVQFDVEKVPTGPEANLPPRDTIDGFTKKCIEMVDKLLDEKPMWTRRAMLNRLGYEWNHAFRFASSYCTYTFISGPWRDALVRFGYDPREDPESRQYQTFTVKLMSRADYTKNVIIPAWRQGRTQIVGGVNPTSHIFDGKTVVRDGSTWQICDVTDPFLLQILNVPTREVCEERCWGWIPSVAMCKLHVVTKEKVRIILEGGEPNDDDFRFILDIPDEVDELVEYMRTIRTMDGRKRSMATTIRQLADETKSYLRGQRRTGERPHLKTSKTPREFEDDLFEAAEEAVEPGAEGDL